MNHAHTNISESNHKRQAAAGQKMRVSVTHASNVRNIIQPKLKIGAPNDKYEQEADRVAEQVMRMPEDVVSRYSEDGSDTSHVSKRTPGIQRLCASCSEEEMLQAKARGQINGGVSAQTHSAIQSLRVGGQALSSGERSFFEPRFGADFSAVRIHKDSRAASVARSINARAFTIGNNIVFGAGEHAPDTFAGKELFAHELTHVIQQQQSDVGIVRRTPVCENDPGTAPAMACQISSGTPNGHSFDIFFNSGNASLSPSDTASLHTLIQNWHDAGGSDRLRVDGFASCEGAPGLNWPLSCNRAVAVAHELVHPSDPGIEGIDQSYVEVFADGETDRFSGASLAQNRRARITLGDMPAPQPPTPDPTPTPTPTVPTVVPCTSLPSQIFSRAGCGGGTDFTHHDFPSLAGVNAAKQAAVWEADNLTFDYQLRNRMRLELSILSGSEGRRMVTHFVGGSGSKLTHNDSSPLGMDALASAPFLSLKRAVIRQIESQLASMHAAGVIDCNAIALSTGSVPAVSFGFSDPRLKGIIGGTQGLRVRISRFNVNPGLRSYSIKIQYLICDDFGVDNADLYSPALIAFWVLQHRRSGNLPFINELDLSVTKSASY